MKKILLVLFLAFSSSLFTFCEAQYRNLLNFNTANGASPLGDLTLSGNVFYGMTWFGGANNDGCIFSIHMDGSGYKDLLDFDIANGRYPNADLTLSGKMLYGMTEEGGRNNWGLIFSIDTNGNHYKDLWDFDDTGINGNNPLGSLILIGARLYGNGSRRRTRP